jgi:hypothetical protein
MAFWVSGRTAGEKTPPEGDAQPMETVARRARRRRVAIRIAEP